MELADIYNLLRLWFCAWLVFRSYDLIVVHVRKIGAALRSASERK